MTRSICLRELLAGEQLVAVRRSTLDELERRDGDGFRAVPGDRSRCVRAVGEGGG